MFVFVVCFCLMFCVCVSVECVIFKFFVFFVFENFVFDFIYCVDFFEFSRSFSSRFYRYSS